ncbi:autotransporter outer membrane beta-barrel domain-containing protein [Arcobacter sp. F155]|uniref:autotransporter family protein n=1 Tax=Arcobacter sp. F155 TaxID=2044512 RepID=UPI0013E8FBEE|nr:autotransporter outer membrane beta-barrel domain-containing protein [Arcobacter sp. F155]
MLGKKIKLSLISASLLCSSLSADLIINNEVNSQQTFDGNSESALITENGFINFNTSGNHTVIINVANYLDFSHTFKNRGKIHTVSTSGWANGVNMGDNNSTVSNEGEIKVSGVTIAAGIGGNSSATINNSGTIEVYTTSGNAKGMHLSKNTGTINNSGTIIARKNKQRDYNAYSILITYDNAGTINNAGTLDGNINAPGQTLTNSGNIILPYNANGTGANAAYIANFTNKANGVLQVYLQAGTGGTMEHSRLNTISSVFEDGSTIKVNVLGLSSDIELLKDQTMTNVVYSNTSNLDIQGTLNITDNSALLDFEYVADADSIDLNIIEGSTILDSVSGNSNLNSIASLLDNLNGNISSMNSLFSALNALPTDSEVAGAIESLLPQIGTSSFLVGSSVNSNIQALISQRQGNSSGLNSGDMILEKNKRLWLKPFASSSKQDNKDGISGFDVDSYGIGMGSDIEYKENHNFGLGLFYTNSDVDVNGLSQSSDLDIYTLLAYGSNPFLNDYTFSYQGSYSLQRTDSNRQIFTGENIDASYTSKLASLYLKLDRSFSLNDTWSLKPNVSLLYRHFSSPSYKESGSTSANLKMEEFSSTDLIPSIGLDSTYTIDDSSYFSIGTSLGYNLHDNDNSISASFVNAPNAGSFTSKGIDNGNFNYDVSLSYQKEYSDSKSFDVTLSHNGVGSSFSNNAIHANFIFEF